MAGDTLQFVDAAVARIGRSPEAVIPLLQALQEHYRYLPEPALERICALTDIRPATLWGIATFYDQFRHRPAGKHIVHVCHGTACHVTGADRVEDALRRQLRIAPGEDTDPQQQFTIESVACLGCCTLAPVIKIDQQTYGHISAEKLPGLVRDFLALDAASPSLDPQLISGIAQPSATAQIHVGLGSCCMAKGSDRLFAALEEAAREFEAQVLIKRVGCVGMCHRTPLIEIRAPNHPPRLYAAVQPADAHRVVRQHFRPRGVWRRITRACREGLDRLLTGDVEAPIPRFALDYRDSGVSAFLGRQIHIASEHFGHLDPLDLAEYEAHDGFRAIRQVLNDVKPDQIINIIERSGLRGRGGAGFPSGPKWEVVRRQDAAVKYVICNGDEGDPGAFMDRMLLESFPYRIIEGLAIAAVAVGAHEGFFYIRREYPLAVSRIRAALDHCEQRGWLGERLMGFDYPLRLSIKEGAGAFVCGEETALIASIEGERGMPRLRPPFPAESGLWNKPTLINNVETLAMVPWIIRRGADAFAALGTPTSKGTKVFALAGKVQRGGLIEVPMGTTIREIVEDIGGGVPAGGKFKAVQIGGPSGGCIPARLADTPVDYESLGAAGAIMGSGGLVVLDDTDCMVDIARYFLQFTQDQSCGKCTFCRIGTRRMLDILERICSGKGRPEQLAELEQLARQVNQGSLCGLGKTAPNPVLTTLRYFRSEYEAHLRGRCPAKRCTALIRYQVTADCTGCTLCAQHCPVNAIPMAPYQRHVINQELCTRCDTCKRVCPHNAIEVS